MKIKQNTTKNKVYYTVLTISYYILLYLTIPLCFSLSNALLPAWCWSWGRVAPTTAAPCANMQSCTTRIFDSQTRSRESNPASPSLNRRNPGTIREQSGNSLHSKRATVARRCKRKHFKHFQTFSNLDVSTCSKSSQLVVSTGAPRCRLLNSKRNWRMTPRKSCRTCRRSWMERTRNCKQCPGYHWWCSDVSNLSKVFRTFQLFSDWDCGLMHFVIVCMIFFLFRPWFGASIGLIWCTIFKPSIGW